MEISKGLATNIVYEMKKIIDKDLNFIQSDGKIIASTDKLRINTYHEGAKKAILLNDIVVIDWDEQYPGAKKGINIPVKFYEETIGVIGISGNKEEVEKYGEIIKRITEILIKEAYLLNKDERENENERLFLEKILFSKNNMIFEDYGEIIKRITEILIKEAYLLNKDERENENERLFLEKILFSKNNMIFEDNSRTKNFKKILFGKNISIFIASIDFIEEDNIERIKEIFNIFKKIIKRNNGYLMINQNMIIVLLIDKNYDDIKKIIDMIEVKVSFIKKINIKYGVGEIKSDIKKIKNSYEEALNSLEWSIKDKKKYIFYNDMDLELILNMIDEKTEKNYLKKIFKNLSEKEIEEWSIKDKKKYIFYNDMDLELILNMIDEKTEKNYLKKIFKNLSEKEIEEYKNIFYYYEIYNGSLKKISEKLFMHTNTLQYKLNKFYEKTQCDIRKYNDFSKLKMAFMIKK